MKYKNAAEFLPERLLREIQSYIDGDLLYIPKSSSKKQWGTVSGAKSFYRDRNQEIKRLFRKGWSIADLSKEYGLADSTIKKIIYR